MKDKEQTELRLRGNLRRIEMKLRKYCHSSTCKKPRECPEDHPACRRSLDLDTAIAWVAADQICSLYSEYVSHVFEGVYEQICTLLAVVREHPTQYEKLFESIYEALFCLDNIIRLLETG